jgi:hypothetical protein
MRHWLRDWTSRLARLVRVSRGGLSARRRRRGQCPRTWFAQDAFGRRNLVGDARAETFCAPRVCLVNDRVGHGAPELHACTPYRAPLTPAQRDRRSCLEGSGQARAGEHPAARPPFSTTPGRSPASLPGQRPGRARRSRAPRVHAVSRAPDPCAARSTLVPGRIRSRARRGAPSRASSVFDNSGSFSSVFTGSTSQAPRRPVESEVAASDGPTRERPASFRLSAVGAQARRRRGPTWAAFSGPGAH